MLNIPIISPVYNWLWQHPTGRPWTDVVRAWTAKRPRAALIIVIISLAIDALLLGAAAAALPRWAFVPVAFLNTSFGLIAGHILWSAREENKK